MNRAAPLIAIVVTVTGCQAVLGLNETRIEGAGSIDAAVGVDIDGAPGAAADAADGAVGIPTDHTLYIPFSSAAADLDGCYKETGYGEEAITNRHGVALTESCFFEQNPGEEWHKSFANAELGSNATIAAWIRPSYPGSNAFAVGEEGYPALSRSQTNERMAMIVEYNDMLYEATDDISLPNQDWTFYVGVMDFNGTDGTEIRLYRDSALVATTMVSGFLHSDQECGVAVGGHAGAGAPCGSRGFDGFQGTFDDVRIFNRVLSQAEIDALYNEPAP